MTHFRPRLLIKNGTLIDGRGCDPVPNMLVVVEGNRIADTTHCTCTTITFGGNCALVVSTMTYFYEIPTRRYFFIAIF